VSCVSRSVEIIHLSRLAGFAPNIVMLRRVALALLVTLLARPMPKAFAGA